MNTDNNESQNSQSTDPDVTSPAVDRPLPEANSWGVAAFVLGLIGALVGLLIFLFPIVFVLGMLALVFGLVGLRTRARRQMTAAGVVLGGVAIILSVVGGFMTLRVIDTVTERVDRLDQDIEEVLDNAITKFGRELDTVVDDTSDKIVEEIDDIDDEVGKQIEEKIEEQVNRIDSPTRADSEG